MPLREENGFLPDLRKIPHSTRKKARLLYFNYPNNPTGAVCPPGFYAEVAGYCGVNNIIAVSDLAYSEMAYDGYRPPSFLQTEGAQELGIEFHSLSKTYNMTGWRVGWACGNKRLIAGLAKVKSNVDSGIFSAIQQVAVAALDSDDSHISQMCRMYQERRDVLVDGLVRIGWKVMKPKATFYVWARVPRGARAIEFCGKLLRNADIVATPGVGFGDSGEGYIRFALTVDKSRIQEAVDRLEKRV
jgi:LL-diaminopimelate aminotransferase